MVRVYNFFEKNDVEGGCYNAGFENISIIDLAEKLKIKLIVQLILYPQMILDPIIQDSSKLLSLGLKKNLMLTTQLTN